MTFQSLHMLRSANTLKNGSKSCLTFAYCFPIVFLCLCLMLKLLSNIDLEK